MSFIRRQNFISFFKFKDETVFNRYRDQISTFDAILFIESDKRIGVLQDNVVNWYSAKLSEDRITAVEELIESLNLTELPNELEQEIANRISGDTQLNNRIEELHNHLENVDIDLTAIINKHNSDTTSLNTKISTNKSNIEQLRRDFEGQNTRLESRIRRQ